mmetsp:Transcript_60028/g.142076  ORF Transcript_60028/g.142076 Transcript_60028/m.142076 type:complete len:214 (-) Transcript_60028:804-1445(-)
MTGQEITHQVLDARDVMDFLPLLEKSLDRDPLLDQGVVLASGQRERDHQVDRAADQAQADHGLQGKLARQPRSKARCLDARHIHGRSSSTYPTPRTVWSSGFSKGWSNFARKRRIATSTTLVSLSKFMSQTCSASVVRDIASPRRRISSVSSVNSCAVSSMRSPARWTRRADRSTSRSARRSSSWSSIGWGVPRRITASMRASSSEKAKGLAR